MPFWRFLTARYYFYSYLLTCKWCCCKKKYGKIEKFKKKIIREMLMNKDTRDSFIRYCLNNNLDDDLKKEMEKVKWKRAAGRALFKNGNSAFRKKRNLQRIIDTLSPLGKKIFDYALRTMKKRKSEEKENPSVMLNSLQNQSNILNEENGQSSSRKGLNRRDGDRASEAETIQFHYKKPKINRSVGKVEIDEQENGRKFKVGSFAEQNVRILF